LPLADTATSLGFSSSIPTISMGCENERVTVTVRLSACITMVSDGINIPKWAVAGTAVDTIQANKVNTDINLHRRIIFLPILSHVIRWVDSQFLMFKPVS